MEMWVPDFWKGRGRYSQTAIRKKVVDKEPYEPREPGKEEEEDR